MVILRSRPFDAIFRVFAEKDNACEKTRCSRTPEPPNMLKQGTAGKTLDQTSNDINNRRRSGEVKGNTNNEDDKSDMSHLNSIAKPCDVNEVDGNNFRHVVSQILKRYFCVMIAEGFTTLCHVCGRFFNPVQWFYHEIICTLWHVILVG